jgi:small subunit ribosomal protein S16
MRLTRTGARKRPSYRVVVADSSAPRDGRHVEIVGFYDPMTNPSTLRIDTDRAVRWLQNGAQPTERVRVLLRHAGVLMARDEARLAARRALARGVALGGEEAMDTAAPPPAAAAAGATASRARRATPGSTSQASPTRRARTKAAAASDGGD